MGWARVARTWGSVQLAYPCILRRAGRPKSSVLIIAATADEKLRIFDKETGDLLWQYQLPAAGYATPSTYEIDGRQFIVVTCSGGKLGTRTGDQYIAFALPPEK